MTDRATHALRSAWWRRFHPLVRVGWYTATMGSTRPTSQTALGVGMIVAGVLLRRSQKAHSRPIYVHKLSPGESARIRVYRGSGAPSEVTVRT